MRALCILLVLYCFAPLSCRPIEGKKLHLEPEADTLHTVSESEIFMRRDGKLFGIPAFKDIYRPVSSDTLAFPFIDANLATALRHQLNLLEKSKIQKNHRIGSLAVSEEQLRDVIHILLQWQHSYPSGIHNQLETWQIRGDDKRSNVLFTGYFTPIVPVKDKREAPFLHPIYDRPRNWNGPYPTRREIEAGKALDGLGLELAYAKDLLDIYFMHVQGSGFIEFPNGKRKYLAYNGTNRHPFRSIEGLVRNHPDAVEKSHSPTGIRRFFNAKPHLLDSLLHLNPSYTFFAPSSKAPEGAGNVPLTGLISIAVDPRYIPLGSCLLAALPQVDPGTKSVKHQYVILLAQDTGGSIRGPGHVDFYTGIGANAGKKASQIRHYGRLWLLLPRKLTRPPFKIS